VTATFCPAENTVIGKVSEHRQAVRKLQELTLLPTRIKFLYCKLMKQNKVTFDFLFRHGCLYKTNGGPCIKLDWANWQGVLEFDTKILELFNWTEQHENCVLKRKAKGACLP
jgi:hypothetical protein